MERDSWVDGPVSPAHGAVLVAMPRTVGGVSGAARAVAPDVGDVWTPQYRLDTAGVACVLSGAGCWPEAVALVRAVAAEHNVAAQVRTPYSGSGGGQQLAGRDAGPQATSWSPPSLRQQ